MENFIGYLQLYFKIHTLESDTDNYIKWDSDFTILPTKETMDHLVSNIKNMMEQHLQEECEVFFVTKEEYIAMISKIDSKLDRTLSALHRVDKTLAQVVVKGEQNE